LGGFFVPKTKKPGTDVRAKVDSIGERKMPYPY